MSKIDYAKIREEYTKGLELTDEEKETINGWKFSSLSGHRDAEQDEKEFYAQFDKCKTCIDELITFAEAKNNQAALHFALKLRELVLKVKNDLLLSPKLLLSGRRAGGLVELVRDTLALSIGLAQKLTAAMNIINDSATTEDEKQKQRAEIIRILQEYKTHKCFGADNRTFNEPEAFAKHPYDLIFPLMKALLIGAVLFVCGGMLGLTFTTLLSKLGLAASAIGVYAVADSLFNKTHKHVLYDAAKSFAKPSWVPEFSIFNHVAAKLLKYNAYNMIFDGYYRPIPDVSYFEKKFPNSFR